MKLLTTILSIVFSLKVSAIKLSTVWPSSTGMLDNVRDISFVVKTNSLGDLINMKDSIEAKVYWMPEKNEIIIVNKADQEKEALLKEAFKSRVSILWGDSFDYYIKNYKYLGLIKGWHRFEDPLGVEDNNEIWIKKNKLNVSIIEKKPIGTQYIDYKFEKINARNILTKVIHKSFIGLQSFLSESKIEYKEIESHLLPVKITTITTQKVTTNESNTPKRDLREEYIFYGYKVNESSALEWFSKR
jgi:hypothetical protein